MTRSFQRYVVLFTLFFSPVIGFCQDTFQLKAGTTVVLPDVEKGKSLISVPDEYTAVFSLFDLQSKTRRTDTPTVADYLSNAAAHVMALTVIQGANAYF